MIRFDFPHDNQTMEYNVHLQHYLDEDDHLVLQRLFHDLLFLNYNQHRHNHQEFVELAITCEI
jgi:endo-beta-N-acetylglucosaminidase D